MKGKEVKKEKKKEKAENKAGKIASDYQKEKGSKSSEGILSLGKNKH